MTKLRKHKLIEARWPEFGKPALLPETPAAEFKTRLENTSRAMEQLGLTHLLVYADREHFANMTYLTGFDPRFEEALLIIRAGAKPLLLVGNESEGFLTVSPLFNYGSIRAERYQPFSLLDQPRDASRLIKDIFSGEKITAGAKVGCAGWKYFSEKEHPGSRFAIEIPAFLVDALRELAGKENVINAGEIFMHPAHGLRARCTASEIASFEYTNVLASEGMRNMIRVARPGMTDLEIASASGYNGLPLACHMTLAAGENSGRGLSGPTGVRIKTGDPVSLNLSYRGSNSCRAGWIASGPDDLPPAARNYIDGFAGPYFSAVGAWFEKLTAGTKGGELEKIIADNLPFSKFGIFLNPGHLIHLDEWLSSPVYRGSEIPLVSGMAMQSDIIPVSETFFSTRVEDGLVLADKKLQDDLKQKYPDCHSRCVARRDFMRDTLGIPVRDDVLPLSNIPGIVPPFFLKPELIFALEK